MNRTPAVNPRPGTVDADLFEMGLAQADTVARIMARWSLGDTSWSLEDLELRLATLSLLDASIRNLRQAAA